MIGAGIEARQRPAAEAKGPHPVDRTSAARRGYDRRWRRARFAYLSRHPLCVRCAAAGITRAATDVDHVLPHRGDHKLFWDEANWQSLCQEHHAAKSARERHGTADAVTGCDVDGLPLDPNHPWRR